MAQPAIVLILVGISCLAQSYAQQLSGEPATHLDLGVDVQCLSMHNWAPLHDVRMMPTIHASCRDCREPKVSTPALRAQFDIAFKFPGGRRFLQQEESTPSAVAAPSGTTVLYDFHAIGTQNYTARELPSHKPDPDTTLQVNVVLL
jgi:hypothetical protein